MTAAISRTSAKPCGKEKKRSWRKRSPNGSKDQKRSPEFGAGPASEPPEHGCYPSDSSSKQRPGVCDLKAGSGKNVLTIKEISESGSVPELKMINHSDVPVLLLDGEELSGAKQNRVLNTSILLKKKSETVIPVSCTEQGRWSYVSDRFDDSDVVMSPKIGNGNE
jgi:hypothetical protein